ncbi:MAG: YHYH protein [Phycisphaerae bacterium]|jgi:hypothetical protein
MSRHLLVVAVACSSLAVSARATDPALSSWVQNLSNLRGRSTNATINASVSQISADVQQVRFTATNAYINSTDIPHYNIGPWTASPNTAALQNVLVRIPRSPTVQTGAKTTVGLGAVGVMVDGTLFFNSSDARSYNNRNVWHNNANVIEAASFDSALGHPSPTNAYHYHQTPRTLRAELGDDGSRHSPIIGFAYDGFPVYGPFGYANANGTGGIVRMTPSYRLRAITQRTTLPSGTSLASADYGPAIGGTYPLGAFIEDYEYVAGSGTLDQYNGRVCVTPEYPSGTFAYFITVDAANNGVYPYILGPQYYGVVAADTLSRTVTVPGTADRYYPCAADYNVDGGVDGADIGAFFIDWQAGADRADVNYDGGVDGSDVGAFFDLWSNGGC